MQHFLNIADHDAQALRHVLEVGSELRRQRQNGQPNPRLLAGKTLAMLFEKPSLRTRVSFQQAMTELGGDAIVMAGDEVGLGKRESCADVARVLSGMVHGIMARVFEHDKLTELASAASVPVVNALSDHSHPCQALADVMTLTDAFGPDLAGRRVAYVGDGNNVTRSLLVLCARLGVHVSIACPAGHALEAPLVQRVRDQHPGIEVRVSSDPVQAVTDADAVYTDTWVSMGQEAQKQEKLKAFAGFQINDDLLAHCPEHAIVLHCLPAYRGVEITDAVMDGPRSRVFPQAHNRLHAQKGLLAVLMGGA